MSSKFENQLHPELVKRVSLVMQDLTARGWHPVIPEVYGTEGTGYRSLADQQALIASHPERTSVHFSFHNATDAQGNPQSMAVHIMDKNLGNNLPKGHPFLQDLQTFSKRHGLVTGNAWKKPWDPLHVQLFNNSDKAFVAGGGQPDFLSSKLRLFPPTLKLNQPTNYIPPRTMSNFNAGEQFKLQSHFGASSPFKPYSQQQLFKPTPFNSPPPFTKTFAPLPPLTKPEFGSSNKFSSSNYSPNYTMGNLNSLRQPASGIKISDFHLREPSISPGAGLGFGSFKLQQPMLGDSFKPAAFNLGNFQLKPPSF